METEMPDRAPYRGFAFEPGRYHRSTVPRQAKDVSRLAVASILKARGAEMNRTHLAVYRKCTGRNFSTHAPALLGSVSTRERLEDMRPAPGAHLESMAESAGFKGECSEDVESFDVLQLEVQVPAYGRIHQAIPA
jgi:hypothetical protein